MNTEIVGARLNPEDIEKLDLLAEHFSRSRSDTLRFLIRISFEVFRNKIDPRTTQEVNNEPGQ